MILELRKVITMLEECCMWDIFNAEQLVPHILRKAAANSIILGDKNLKKVLRNPGGTDGSESAIVRMVTFYAVREM